MKKMLFSLLLISSLFAGPVCATASVSPSLHSTNDCSDFERHQHGKYLMLMMCRLQDNDIPALVDYLAGHPKIQYLMLEDNKIGEVGAKLLAQGELPPYVYLNNNKIGAAGASALAQNPTIRKLFLNNNKIDTAGAIALAKNNTITMLDIGNNDVETPGIVALANNTTLRILLVSDTVFDDIGKAALINNVTLLGFDISRTNMNYDDIKALIQRPRLTSFIAEDLHLGNKGAELLAQKNSLAMLFLRNNEIGPEGAVALGKLPYLEELDIGKNAIGDEGMAALATISRIFLIVDHNNLSDASVFSLVNSNAHIGYLVISDNHLSHIGIKVLKNSLSIGSADTNNNDGDVFIPDHRSTLTSIQNSFNKLKPSDITVNRLHVRDRAFKFRSNDSWEFRAD